MGRYASNGLRHAATAQPGQAQGAGKDLIEKFLADLDRSWQEHGPETFHTVMINQPRLYFRALVMLAQVQDRGSSKLSELDRQRNRTEGLAALVHARAAAKDPTLSLNTNHGHPTVAATAHPAQFKGLLLTAVLLTARR